MNMEYLYDKLKKYSISGHYGFHMPGHKRNVLLTNAELPYKIDITEIEGFDDLHHPSELLLQCQRRASSVFKSDETHYLINGSTVGILCAILGNTNQGDSILIARNCHKSVYNAVYMNKLRPIYIYPENDCKTGINGPIDRQKIKEALVEFPDIKAVVITSPTYDGVVSDVAGISEIVHKKNIPLIVDEAHGSHFGFHSYFPANSNCAGADVVIHSLHKTLPSLTQTALLHMNGNITDRHRVRRYLHMLQTSSPSYVLMSSIDECVRYLETVGDTAFRNYVELLRYTRERLKQLNVLKLVETDSYDRSKILISTKRINNIHKKTKWFTGKDLYERLLKEYKLQMELADPFYILGMTSPGDTAEGMNRLIDALNDIDAELEQSSEKEYLSTLSERCAENIQIYTPCEAEDEVRSGNQQTKSISLDQCAGMIAMEYIYVYPPGIPLTVPGEKISPGTQEQLDIYQKAGFAIQGMKEKGRIEVLKYG